MTTLRSLLAFAVLSCSATALAVPKVTVAPFSGPDSEGVRDQLLREVCETLDCISPKKVMSGSKVDYGKVTDERVRGVITGKVNAVGKLAALYIVVTGADREELLPKKRFPLKDFKLDKKELASAVRSIAEAVSTAKEPDESKPRKSAKSSAGDEESEDPLARDDEEDEAVNAPKKSSKKTGVVVEEEEEAPKRKKQQVVEEEEEEEAPKKRAGRGREPREEKPEPPSDPVATQRGAVKLGKPGKDTYFASIEVGTEIYSRRFGYSPDPNPKLRSYGAGAVISPLIFGEIYPFVSRTDLLSGLGAEVGATASLGLTSKQSQASTAPHPTSITRVDFAFKFKFRPVASSELQIVPTLGFRTTNFTVGQAEDTTTLDGLPNVGYFALRLGAGVQIPLVERFTPFFRFELLPVLSETGQLIGPNTDDPTTPGVVEPTYFNAGSAFGFELSLGSGIRVTEHLDVRLGVRLTRYGLGFTSEPTDPFDADSASDFYIGGSVGLRYLF
ncbi:MAG: hypothetical protein ACT4TC_06130 [Myxococcaceae bacterium]